MKEASSLRKGYISYPESVRVLLNRFIEKEGANATPPSSEELRCIASYAADFYHSLVITMVTVCMAIATIVIACNTWMHH